ncbi:MAG: hypothetical protein WC273_00910 [Dehalococcoidia bacterium]
MKTIDADVVVQAITEIAGCKPLFRTQPELQQYMSAIERIAAVVGMTVPWGQGAPE